MSRCAFVKPDGERCQRIVSDTATYCYAHDPSKAEQRKASAKKAGSSGGRGRPRVLSEEVGEVKARLRAFVIRVQLPQSDERHADRGTAIVVNQLLNTLLRAIELERKTHEGEELEERLEEVEELLERHKGGRYAG